MNNWIHKKELSIKKVSKKFDFWIPYSYTYNVNNL